MTAPSLSRCRFCRKQLDEPALPYCPQCGTSQDLDMLSLVALGGSARIAGATERRAPRAPRSFLRLGLFAAVAIGALALLGQTANDDLNPQPTSTTRALSPETTRVEVTDLATTTSLVDATPTPLGTVSLPNSIDGFVYGLRDDGSLVEIDLTSGTARGWRLPTLSGKSPVRIYAVTDGLLVSSAGRSIAVPFNGGPRRVTGYVPGTVIAAGITTALVDVDSDNAGYVVIDGTGRRLVEGQLGPERRPVAASDGRVVVAATGQLGLIDFAGTERATSILTGRLLAADGLGPAWLDCATLTSCTLRMGTWATPSQITFNPPLRPGGQLDAAFTTGQRHLVVTSSGVGGSSSYLIDMANGAMRQLRTIAPNSWGIAVSKDRGWLVTIPADQTVQTILFEELKDNGRTISVPVPGRFVALTMTSQSIVEGG